MKLAKRLGRVQASATLAVNAKALELRKKGINVISLAVGEPDFNTPEHIAEAGKKAIDEHFTRYADVSGIIETKNGVCSYYEKTYSAHVKPENVVICNGGKQALYDLLLCLLDPEDEVLIPIPYWTSYPDMTLLVGAEPVYVLSNVDKNFKISIDDLEKVRTPKTKMLILNSPSNPSGATYTQSELNIMLEWALQHDIFVIADEVYDQLVYDGEVASAVTFWEKHPENLAILNSVSKSFAMTGWRIGYCVASPTLCKEVAKIQGQSTSSVCSIAQRAAACALSSSYDCIIPMKEAFKRRRDFAHAHIATWEGVRCPKPEGAFYLFPDVSALFCDKYPDASSLCTYLLEEAQVAVMPGTAFGDPNCIRLSYAVSDETLQSALDAMKNALYQ